MTPVDHDLAARLLVDARREGRTMERLPEGARPRTDDDALRVQRRILELLGEEVGGWKTALPRGDDLFIAPIPASRVHRGPVCPAPDYGGKARIEPEVAFVLDRGLPPRDAAWSEDEITAAIGETRLVLEIMGARFTDPLSLPFREFLADSINNQGLLVGPVLTDPFQRDLSGFRITVEGPEGEVVAKDGSHPNGNPLKGLLWLAEYLRGRGEGLRAGEVVTTGSYAGVLEVPVDTELALTFGDLGGWSVTLTPERPGGGASA